MAGYEPDCVRLEKFDPKIKPDMVRLGSELVRLNVPGMTRSACQSGTILNRTSYDTARVPASTIHKGLNHTSPQGPGPHLLLPFLKDSLPLLPLPSPVTTLPPPSSMPSAPSSNPPPLMPPRSTTRPFSSSPPSPSPPSPSPSPPSDTSHLKYIAELLLAVANRPNHGPDRLSHALACESLRKLEHAHPLLLSDVVGHLWALAQAKRTHAAQSYLVLLAAVIRNIALHGLLSSPSSILSTSTPLIPFYAPNPSFPLPTPIASRPISI